MMRNRKSTWLPTPWTSTQWCDYFRTNAQSLLSIPWDNGAELSGADRVAIARSVQAFQLGESSEGRHLQHYAHLHAFRTGDHDYAEAIRLFILEEQRHGRDLGRFLTSAEIPLLTRFWVDTVFRWMRSRAGLELSIAVLITAEIIAKVYYRGLCQATRSSVLRRLCDQILRDEAYHVRFQCERLAVLRNNRSRRSVMLRNGFQRVLFCGSCLIVWWQHGRVLRAGGFGFGRFWCASMRELNIALRKMDPRSYCLAGRRKIRELIAG